MDIDPIEDQLVTRLPIHFSNSLEPNIHVHQFPLLTRPLQVPPSAASAGKRIRARIKTSVRKLEVHVPVDTRPEVWNPERGTELGQARVEDDREKNQELLKVKQREGEEPRLAEVRMQSERVAHKGVYMLGIVRDGASGARRLSWFVLADGASGHQASCTSTRSTRRTSSGRH